MVDEVLQKREPLKESPKLTKNDFELLKTVGKGSFGKVFQVLFSAQPIILRCGIKEMERFMQ